MRALVDTERPALVALPPGWAEVVEAGWVREPDGCVVAVGLRASYRGTRAQFTDRVGYEAAVNGRAVYDLDVSAGSPDRAQVLFGRAVSIASAMFARVGDLHPIPGLTALVSITETLTDEPVLVGQLTFWADHEGEEPYVLLDDAASGEAIAIMRNA